MPSLLLMKKGTLDTVFDRQPWTHLFQHAGVSSLLLRKANTVLWGMARRVFAFRRRRLESSLLMHTKTRTPAAYSASPSCRICGHVPTAARTVRPTPGSAPPSPGCTRKTARWRPRTLRTCPLQRPRWLLGKMQHLAQQIRALVLEY